MEQIICVLKAQNKIIQNLRKILNKYEPEPADATETFVQLEEIYNNALVECGKLSK